MVKEVECEETIPLTSPSAAKIIGIKPGTLGNWRWSNKGPKYFKAGSKVFYDKKDVHQWLEDRKVDPEKGV